MKQPKRHRIKFFSKDDGALFSELKNSEEILNNYNKENQLELIDLFEFYNIKLYFDNNLFLPTWSDHSKIQYIKIVEFISKILKQRILKINEITLEEELNSLDYNYFDNFWNLINNLSAYKNFDEICFAEVLKKNQRQINKILTQKKIVEKFDRVLREFLMDYANSAEIILSSIEEKDIFSNKKLKFFPKSLTVIDKEIIINAYLDSEEPNLNYVRLIENTFDSNELKLNAKTRLKAKKKSTLLNEKLFQNINSWRVGISVSFSKDQMEPVKYISDGSNLEASYSESFLDQIKDNINRFKIFKNLFFYTDDKNLINLVSKPSETDVIEGTFMKSKNEYETTLSFLRKENFANIQLFIFDHYLQRNENNIEKLINSYIDFLNEKIKPHKLIFKIALNEKSDLEKIRTIAPDFDFLLKQFKSFVDEKSIDLELLQISSAPIRFSEIYSTKEKKYLYSNNELILRLKHLFFSDQSHLFYTKHFENKYHNLYDLLTNENVKLEHFANYQKDTIVSLIKDSYLKIDYKKNIILNKDLLIFLIGEIHKNDVISYWNYPKIVRECLDELVSKDLMKEENTLFTCLERKYLNFYLNKKEFTNGHDLRNKYLHGTNSFSEDEHKLDYYKLLKIIILTLLKIEDDITLVKE